MTKKLTDQEVALLNEPQIATVATVMADGSPHLTAVWVDTDGEAVLFNTGKSRVKYRNLVRNPKVAVTVVDKDNFFRLVNVRGTAEVIEEGADEHADRLAKKYLGVDRFAGHKEGEQRVIVRVAPD